MSGHYRIVRSREAWEAQAQAALVRVEATGAANLDEAMGVDRDAVAEFLEALVALGQPVDPDLCRRAGLRPVEDVLG